MIDDCKPAHFFTNSLSAHVYKFIACKLHNSLFVSFPKRKLCERYRTTIQYVPKFRVLPHDLSFVLTTFLWLNETLKKNRPLFKRIIARYAMKFHANFHRKITGRKNEIRTFHLHYFCTVLYKAFVLPHFQYCSAVWHFCSSKNSDKLESLNKCTLHIVFNDRDSTYCQLLERATTPTLYNLRVQNYYLKG